MTDFQATIIVLASIGAIATLIKIGEWKGKVDTDRDSFKNFMGEIRNKLDKLIFHLIPDTVVSSASPTRLTELGKSVSNMINATNLAEQLAVELEKEVVGKSPYEIQEFCNDYMINKFEPSPDQIIKFGNCAYEKGIQVESVSRVISIELRDKLLELSGYTVAHLD